MRNVGNARLMFYAACKVDSVDRLGELAADGLFFSFL